MNGPEIVIPVFFFISVAVIWGSAIVTRHKERMTIIEKGLDPNEMRSLYERSFRFLSPLNSLKWGIVFVSIGVAVLLGMWLHQSLGVDKGAIAGLICLLGGAGLIVFYGIARGKTDVLP